MRLRSLLPCLALCACADKDSPARSDQPYAICDGSDDVRLALVSQRGQLELTSTFTNPYGWTYLFVNGRCEFVAAPDISTLGDAIEGSLPTPCPPVGPEHPRTRTT